MELNRSYVKAKLATAAVLLSAAVLAFAISAGYITPCNTVLAQSTSCSVGDTETFTGATTFSDEINVGATPGPGTAYDLLTSAGAGAPTEWGSTVAVKSADETIVSDTTLTPDVDLVLTVAANAVYSVDGLLFMTSDTTPDFKWQWTVPAGATLDAFQFTAGSPSVFQHSEAASSQAAGTAALVLIGFSGTLNTAAAAGSVTLDWAQQNSDPGNTTLHEDSWVTLRRIR